MRQTVPAASLPSRTPQEVEHALPPRSRGQRPTPALSARRAAAGGDLSEADEKLLAALYALRKRLAAKQNVPAYMVFSDATLREMVQSKPLSMDEFLNITGVGEKESRPLWHGLPAGH